MHQSSTDGADGLQEGGSTVPGLEKATNRAPVVYSDLVRDNDDGNEFNVTKGAYNMASHICQGSL